MTYHYTDIYLSTFYDTIFAEVKYRDVIKLLSCRGKTLAANENPKTTFGMNDRTANATVYVFVEIILRFIDKGARPGGFSNNTPTKIAAVRLTYLLSISMHPLAHILHP